MNASLPIIDCWVARPTARHRIGRVARHLEHDAILVDFGPDSSPEVLPEGDWVCGLQPGFTVQDVPLSASRKTLGVGTVVNLRQIAGREQVAVHFHLTGELRWIPFERLKRVMDPRLTYIRAQQAGEDAAERCALNLMGEALRTWNEATGALGRLDADPLPHQIGLVHTILTAGHANFIVADDPALGKAIEVGLLLGALERRQGLARVLFLAPAATIVQWQEELAAKFGMAFSLHEADAAARAAPEQPRLIASIDALRPQSGHDDGTDAGTAFGRLLLAEPWDLVVIDEAHALVGEGPAAPLRMRLASALRPRTDSLLLLTPTPLGAPDGRVRELLMLVRPDLEERIAALDQDASVVNDIVLRNSKADVRDQSGALLFAGLNVRRVEVMRNSEGIELERRLSAYLRRGYRLVDEFGGETGRAIGHLMSIYRKLASSSVFALALAMARRRARLNGEPAPNPYLIDADALDRIAETGEGDDRLADAELQLLSGPFFEEEEEQLAAIIEQAKRCFHADAKHAEFRRIVDELVVRDKRKLLVFTENRATQSYLATRIEQSLGQPPALIHSGLSLAEKQAAVAAFESRASVLITTEAGSEGLNLHRDCATLVNYDLPWSLPRLSQRIARLYRYGQPHKVLVVNLMAKDLIDNEIVTTVLERLDAVVKQMAPAGSLLSDRAQGEAFCELLERLDIEALLVEAGGGQVERTFERIDAAIAEARAEKQRQDELLGRARRSGREGWQQLGVFSTADLAVFIRRASEKLGIAVSPYMDEIERFDIRLPENLRGRFPEFGSRQVIDCRTARRASGSGRLLLDFSVSYVRYLVEQVARPDFGGGYGMLFPNAEGGLIAAYLVRYQNDQGEPRGAELMVGRRGPDGIIELDNGLVRPLFAAPLRGAEAGKGDAATRAQALDAILDRIEVQLADEAGPFRHPSGLFVVGVLEWEAGNTALPSPRDSLSALG